MSQLTGREEAFMNPGFLTSGLSAITLFHSEHFLSINIQLQQ